MSPAQKDEDPKRQRTVPTALLSKLMGLALARRGLSPEDSSDLVDGLIETSLRGVDTHGVQLFPTYLKELDGGRAKAQPELRWLSKSSSAGVLEADAALGPVAGMAGARRALALAKDHGVGAVAVSNSNYFGACSRYALAMARADAVGLVLTNSDALMAPVNGTRPRFGTNPLSFAAPGLGDEIFCADMATSQVSFTKIKKMREANQPLEPGWALTADGRDGSIAEPDEPIAALLPLGGAKGQCLAMMIEILTCLLAGMPFDHQLSHFYSEPFDTPRTTSHFLLALDISTFHPTTSFRSRLSELLDEVRSTPAVPGEKVLAPGDLESATAARRRSQGLPLSSELWHQFQRIDQEASPAERLLSS